jgi:tellurite resistance protein TerC
LNQTLLIGAFVVIIVGFLVIDLGILSRRAHAVTFRQSLAWTGFWIAVATAFGFGIKHYLGHEKAVTFAAAYLIELSLSVDNLFVFLLVFSSFRIPNNLQHRVLFWGIIGAIVLRAVCIVAGVAALNNFSWLVYIFGAILVFSGVKTAFKNEDEEENMEEGFVVRLVKRFVAVTPNLHGEKFFTSENGRRVATPMFMALVVVEFSDLIFAVDSIPAVLAISTDPFIVYTSNIFAILGLRSIYFALSHLMQIFRFLKYALSVILIFVGIKISISHFYKMPVELTLGVVFGLLFFAALASVVLPAEAREPDQPD